MRTENDIETARRSISPEYNWHAELRAEWYAKEDLATAKKAETRNPLIWLYWQIKYLSAVGNGAETDRSMANLFDESWGSIDKGAQRVIEAESHRIAIRRHNRQFEKPRTL